MNFFFSFFSGEETTGMFFRFRKKTFAASIATKAVKPKTGTSSKLLIPKSNVFQNRNKNPRQSARDFCQKYGIKIKYSGTKHQSLRAANQVLFLL